MSQRVQKVESLIQQTVAGLLPELLEAKAAAITVTAVDAAPDLRNANVWFGVLDSSDQQEAFKALLEARPRFQKQLAAVMSTKFVPRLAFKLDSGGQYADHISRLLKGL